MVWVVTDGQVFCIRCGQSAAHCRGWIDTEDCVMGERPHPDPEPEPEPDDEPEPDEEPAAPLGGGPRA
jgi:hypothetical protein